MPYIAPCWVGGGWRRFVWMEARAIRHGWIGCEHLLLAFLNDESGAVAGFLNRYGVNAADASASLVRLMGMPPEKGGPRERLQRR